MLDKIAKVADRYEEIELKMSDPTILANYSRLNELSQERSSLEPLVTAYHQYQQMDKQRHETEILLEIEQDADIRQMAEEEIYTLQSQQEQLEQVMRKLLIPKDPRDDRNVYIEIRAGAGGDEAGIFAADLLRMYSRYAEGRGWKTEVVDENSTGVGGYKEVIMQVKGKGAYSRLKYESGVHRVQRVPITESQGRIHTSTTTVAVMPELDDVEVTIDEQDIEIQATLSAGPGGQHMQKNATAIRLTHKPTGIVIRVQTRSQIQNKRMALAILQSRLQEMEEEKQNSAVAAERRSQVGSGERNEKIRTYNYPQSRVTDHRIGFTSYNLPAVMDGDIDPFIDALTIADESAKLASIENE